MEFLTNNVDIENDVVIAVMGVTGAGKSTFIERATGAGLKIGHSLKSCTTTIGIYNFPLNEKQRVFLLDTPGFDDTNRTDSEILKEITWFLTATYSKNIKLAGVIYLHPITDDRMKGSAVKNLALCGHSSLGRVVLATSKWDKLFLSEWESTGAARERELAENRHFWGTMLKHGSKMFRHYDKRDSAMRIIDYLVQLKGNGMVLDIQRQMVDQNLSLEDTAAGQTLQRELIAERRKYEAQLLQLKKDMDEAREADNKLMKETMKQQEEDLEEKIRQSNEQVEEMKINQEKLKEEYDKRFWEAIDELQEELRQAKVAADKQQALLEAQLNEQRERNEYNEAEYQKQIAILREQNDERDKRIAEKARGIRTMAVVQGVTGLGATILGILTRIQPLMGQGMHMMGQAFANMRG